MSYLPALISNWQLAERKTRKIWFTFSEFGGEEQEISGPHRVLSPHTGFEGATRVRSVSCWGLVSGTMTWGKREREEVVETEIFCFVILPRTWLRLCCKKICKRYSDILSRTDGHNLPCFSLTRRKLMSSPWVRPTWFSQSMIIWGSVPTLLPSQL